MSSMRPPKATALVTSPYGPATSTSTSTTKSAALTQPLSESPRQPAMTNTSFTGYGATIMIDDLLTVSLDLNSKPVGRAQGIYSFASQSEFALLMVLNFAFTEGKYNGSNLSVLGRNSVILPVRELPIIGGSGLFRLARGYAEARTQLLDVTTGDAFVEYNAYVFHY